MESALSEGAKELQIPEIENDHGTLLFLKSDTTLSKMAQIAKPLEMYYQMYNFVYNPRLCIMDKTIMSDPIFQDEQMSQIDNKIPKLTFY